MRRRRRDMKDSMGEGVEEEEEEDNYEGIIITRGK